MNSAEFKEWSDDLKKLLKPRVFFRSREPKIDVDGAVVGYTTRTYRREVDEDKPKGKRALRYAKRQRVAAMKAAEGENETN